MKFIAAVEINEQFVKLIAGRYQLKSFVIEDYVVESVLSFNDDQIAAAIAGIMKKNKFKSKSSVICLPRNVVTVRNLHLPSLNTREISQMVGLHIAQIVPYKKEETVFGYRILGSDEMGYTKIVLAIAQSSVLRRYGKIAMKAGLSIEKMSLSSYGAWQYVLSSCRLEMNAAELYLLLDIDSTFTDFIIFSQNNLMFTRSINVGANDILSNQGLNLTKLLGEVKQSLIIFNTEEINKKPVKVFLAGAGVKAKLIKTVEEELGIPVQLVSSPLPSGLGQNKTSPSMENISLTAVATLTPQDNDKIMNFLLPELQIDRSLKENTKDLVVLGSCCIYLFFIISSFFWGRIYNQQRYLEKLNQRSEAIDREMGGLTRQLGRIEFVKLFLARRQLPLFLIYQLQNIIPQEIFLSFMDLNENKVTLRGQATQLSDVFKFIALLEQSQYFKELKTKYTRTKKVKDKEVAEFEFSLDFGP
jgi:Tfp pilus assembly PilM family ATPase